MNGSGRPPPTSSGVTLASGAYPRSAAARATTSSNSRVYPVVDPSFRPARRHSPTVSTTPGIGELNCSRIAFCFGRNSRNRFSTSLSEGGAPNRSRHAFATRSPEQIDRIWSFFNVPICSRASAAVIGTPSLSKTHCKAATGARLPKSTVVPAQSRMIA